ncbi:uncharacterized protein LOC131843998 [Achroia grisella]|uniref:uncharacterized protein LOC131843998 n=1 Tax=Achroia grisella TaxID=688607 RepID=UPI0027D24190|nr:uncharacterized protein LOC131843998 [Achroia grisella]
MLAVRHAKYLGSFPVGGEEHATRVDTVTTHLHLMKENGRAVPVLVVIALTGLRVCNPDDQQSVRMWHALRRISYATCEAPRALFAFVAREPRSEPTAHYCYAFETDTPQQAEELNSLVGNAFRMAFASQLQPSAPLWSKELSGECGGMGVRAPDSLPGLTHHYPPRSPAKCDMMGVTKLMAEVSPSSSEESTSPTEVSSYRRLGERAERGERPPLMRRIARGFGGALLPPDDDDSTPLVADTPTTPTNMPVCLNGGYINEASEAEARTRASNRDVPAPPRRTHNSRGDLLTDFPCSNNIQNGSPVGGCSGTTSSSSGASSCGGSRASGNNNVPRAEPELRQAPWFQQGIPREIALEVLSGERVGAFLVRGSTTQAGCFALSVRVPADFQPSGIAHYLILTTPKGYKIKGFTKEFSSLSALVTHHSVMPELLPAPLRLPRAPRPPRADHAHLDRLAPAARHHHPHHPHHPPAHHHQQHLQNFLAQLDV